MQRQLINYQLEVKKTSLVIISAFLRMLREEDEPKSWKQWFKEMVGLVAFIFFGLIIMETMEYVIALVS